LLFNMFRTFVTVALFFTVALQGALADFAVSTPEITACKGGEVKVSWQAATAPYSVVVVPADDPCGDALLDAGDVDQTFTSFKVDNFKAGQKVQVSVMDANDEEGWSGVIEVKQCPAGSTSPVSSQANSASASKTAATTLVVANTVATAIVSDTPAPNPIGAAANAANPFGDENAATLPHHISIPALTLSGIAAVAAFFL
jgi:hypothetical protein